MLVLTCAHLVTELAFELEVSMLFDAFKLHAFEHAINLVLVELGFKELSDSFKHLGLELFAGSNKFVTVVLVKGHIEPLEHKCVQWLWHVVR